MPTDDFYSSGILCFSDGTPVMRVADIPDVTFSETAEEEPEKTITIARPMEYSFSITISRQAKRRFADLALYGWRAKGHLRKKAIQKAIRLMWKDGGKKWHGW